MRFWIFLLLTGCTWTPSPPRLRVSEALSEPSSDLFAKATGPRRFRFPQDHGAHPEFRTEWWYLTGHLKAKERDFSYQFTLFRNALGNFHVKTSSRWQTTQFYMGHFAVADLFARSYVSFERFARGAAGLAGCEKGRVWLENWSLTTTPEWKLTASQGDLKLDLNLKPQKPIALQGDQGFSQKGRSLGNASYYYSLTRLKTQGRLQTKQGPFDVGGTSWLDREWSTSSLDADTAGWDWFSIQLDTSEELMLYQLRLKQGGVAPTSSGTWIRADGRTERLKPTQFRIENLSYWQSPHSKARYPARWRIEIPEFQAVLFLEPRLPDQEFQGTIHYWEGSCRVSGHWGTRAVSGFAFVELTGYDP